MIAHVVSKELLVATTQVLRRAAPGDFVALAAMYVDFEPKGGSLGLPPRHEPERWLDSLRGYPNFLVLAGDRVVGHGVLCPQGDWAEVAVFVHQDSRGLGLGKLLLNELIAEARRLGLRHIWGTTEYDNVPMLRLAHALGFKPGADPRDFFLDLEESAPIPPARLA